MAPIAKNLPYHMMSWLVILFLCTALTTNTDQMVDAFVLGTTTTPSSILSTTLQRQRPVPWTIRHATNNQNKNQNNKQLSDLEALPPPTKSVVSKVAVAGATGRTGRLVVQELLKRQVDVVAMVRNKDKATELFASQDQQQQQKQPRLDIIPTDLTDVNEIQTALDGCDAVIWCATGFSDAPSGILTKVKSLLGVALTPKQTIDAVGIPNIAQCMLQQQAKTSKSGTTNDPYPRVVMLSSAGVTRPTWDDTTKARFPGSADIPIVRINPFGILNVKAESEEKLRESGKRRRKDLAKES